MTDLEKMKGPWIRTFTKRIVNPLELQVEDIDIRDIAHHLAITNRFVGALKTPLSVAQHSVCVSRLMEVELGPSYALYGLLHDASEAYLGDVSKWLKGHPSMAFYRHAEDRAQAVICSRFNIAHLIGNTIVERVLERTDRLMVRIEGEQGFDIPCLIPDNDRYAAVTDEEWKEADVAIGPFLLGDMDWRSAERAFQAEFLALMRVR